MLNTISKKLIHWATSRNLIIVSTFFILMNIFIMPVIEARVQDTSGGAGTLDLLFSYNPDQAYAMISAYGESGRNFYAISALTADLIYPVVYALLFSLLLAYSLPQAFSPGSWLQKTIPFPFTALIADYLENFCIVIMLLVFPQRIPFLAEVSGFFTTLKWVLTGAATLLVVAGLAGVLVKNVFIRTTQKKSRDSSNKKQR